LINLTFLALEVALKFHAKNVAGSFKPIHALPKLPADLCAHPDGAARVEMIVDGYRHLIGGMKGKIPDYNSQFMTLDSVIAFLTKDAFID
jgi:hypothetical protein